jgi:hypothetical protein
VKVDGELILQHRLSPEDYARYEAAKEKVVLWVRTEEERFKARWDAILGNLAQDVADQAVLYMLCKMVVDEWAAKQAALVNEPYRASQPPGASR